VVRMVPITYDVILSTKKFIKGISGVPEIKDFPGHQKPPNVKLIKTCHTLTDE